MPTRRRRRAPDELISAQRAHALAGVDERLVRTKHRVSLAALACLRGALDAAELVRQALQEIEDARAALAQAEAEE